MPATIRFATLEDVEPIAQLLVANSADEGGALYGSYSTEKVRGWLQRTSPTVVAIVKGKVVGVLFSASRSEAVAPPVRAMLQAWPGQPDNWIYGPVCIDASQRGKQLLPALVKTLKAAMDGREGLLFINENNPRSIHAHQRLGMPVVAEFTLEQQRFVVMTA